MLPRILMERPLTHYNDSPSVMPLHPGTRIGTYEITARIGSGRMGDVYRAKDTASDRDLALKILSAAFTADRDRLAQFQTDVAAIEKLSHPNIARVYGLQQAAGETILVMELVDGPTLADRLTQGPIPLDETVAIATGIIDALEAAHTADVTHRDLTPNNVKIKADGTITVLDFGLIKAGVGIVMGAAAYVSPERARGQPTDKCSDIWSFGVILFEMLSGQRPFTGRTESEILTSVLKTDPNWALLRSDVPWPVGQVLRRCLDKDADRRLPELVFVRLELQDARPTPPPLQGELAEPAAPTRWSLRRVVLGVMILGSLIAGLAVWSLRPTLPTDSPAAAAPVLAADDEYPAPLAAGSGAPVPVVRANDPPTAHLGAPQEVPEGDGPVQSAPPPATEEVGTLTLTLTARDACWIGIAVDGAPRVERVLARDETIEFNIRSEASLRVGNAGALVVLINGQPARPLGADGQILTVRFTPENFSRYLMTP